MRLLRPAVLSLALAGLLSTPVAVAGPAPHATTTAPSAATTAAAQRVVVQAHAGTPAAADAVRAAGGRVTADLPVVDGVAATVPADALAHLERDPAVRAVTPDSRVEMRSTVPADTAVPSSINHVLLRETGADVLHARGITGKGVGVAVVDTGISDVPDLAGRIRAVADPHQPVAPLRGQVACVDLSGEGSCQDSYGHGTFMAGLVAGTGEASGGRFGGVAPGAHLVSIKIAGRDGSADVSKVLAAVQWAVSFKDDHGIRVLNLSLGTDSTAPWEVDPLNLAVQRAWRAGLVVVVAASNRGPGSGTISKPADDPYVLTVGAIDDRQTPATSDDRVPAFSGRGPAHGFVKPDVVAPGGRVVSLRATGSTVDTEAPGGIVSTSYRRGSGTSMSAAVVSGVAALLLQVHSDWTPDRVKHALTSTAVKVAAREPNLVGAGLVHAPSALEAGPGLANQHLTTLSNGTGRLADSRGTVLVQDECPLWGSCPRTDESTSQGRPWYGDAYAGGEWSGQSWYSSQWTGQSWYGSSWYGQSWYGQSWYGSSWYGTEETGTDYGKPVPGSVWYGASG